MVLFNKYLFLNNNLNLTGDNIKGKDNYQTHSNMTTKRILLAEYDRAKDNLKASLKAVRKHDDGFLYLLTINSYGSHVKYKYHNDIICNIVSYDYNGDNGNVSVITNNPDHNLDDEMYIRIDLELSFNKDMPVYPVQEYETRNKL